MISVVSPKVLTSVLGGAQSARQMLSSLFDSLQDTS